MANYFRNNPDPDYDPIGILQSRRALWRDGRKSMHIKDAMRNNAWATVKVGNLTLSTKEKTFEKLYARPSLPKPPPSLTRVHITTAGEWGHATHVEVSFTCYLHEDFKRFDDNWMRTGKKGTVRFGYVEPYHKSEQRSITLENLVVATFHFNTDSNNHYHCNIKMVGASKFAESMEAKGGLLDRGSMKYKTKSIFAGESSHDVTSLEELLLHDAQVNGETPTDDLGDNVKIPNAFGDIIVYEPPVNGAWWAGLGKPVDMLLGEFKEDQWTYHNEYYSLKYVVDRLINNQIMGYARANATPGDLEVMGGVEIICSSEVTRGAAYDVVRSASPMSMLILGDKRGLYKEGETGKDWENDGDGAGAGIKCINENWTDLSLIMLERKLITGAIAAATQTSEQTEESHNNSPKRKSEVLVRVKKFLQEIFDSISRNTGNLFQLTLIENPKNFKQLLVVDSNYASDDTIRVFEFDPIDGDGSTRDMQLESNAGSMEYRAAMFSSLVKQSDINTTIKSEVEVADLKRKAYHDSIPVDIITKVTKTLPESKFGPDEIEGLRTLLNEWNKSMSIGEHKQKQITLYPGLSISISIDGVYGFGIGNHIHTTLCQKNPYRIESNGLAFNVQSVSHTLENNDWQTDLGGLLSIAYPIEFV